MKRVRDVISSSSKLNSYIRDTQIDTEGELVTIRIPREIKNNIYRDNESITFLQRTTYLLVNREEYYNLLRFFEISEEAGPLPLTAIAKVSDELPVGTEIDLNDIILPTGKRDNSTWHLTKNEMKYDGAVYDRMITMLPKRGEIFHREP